MLMGDILQLVISGVMLGSIYSLIAVGFCIVYNSCEAINFAQGEFAMLGGMFAAVVFRAWGVSLPIVVLVALLCSILVGVICERATVAPLKNATVLRLIMLTLGLGISLKAGVMVVWGKFSLGLPSFTEGSPIHVLGATVVPQTLWIIGSTLVIMWGIRLFFQRTLTGKAMMAAADDREAASLVGIRTKSMVSLAFAMSSGIGAFAGIILTPVSLTSFDHGTMLGLKGFCAAILGGMGNIYGAFIGGLILGVLESIGAGLISSMYMDVFAFLILILVLLLKPEGIFGHK